ncbi:DUF5368 family protein [Ramlibacter sp.]|uniref:DUF5368 family protein n=1 Tax=Ramlibacter sp. TaxID=1917967 RepID=UPI002FC809F2
MYEIWLALNIVLEIARPLAVPLLVAAVALAALWGWALRAGGAGWRRGFASALAVAAVVALAAFLLVPSLTKSSLAELGYAVDWLVLAAMAAGAGAVAGLYAWPLLALRAGAGKRGRGLRGSPAPAGR